MKAVNLRELPAHTIRETLKGIKARKPQGFTYPSPPNNGYMVAQSNEYGTIEELEEKTGLSVSKLLKSGYYIGYWCDKYEVSVWYESQYEATKTARSFFQRAIWDCAAGREIKVSTLRERVI